MADNQNKDKDPPMDEDPPMDDYGIDHDRILEICEKVIEKMHERYVIEDTAPFSASEYRDIAQSLESVWNLVRDVLQLDRIIMEGIQGDGQDFTNEDEGPEDEENEE